MNRVLSRNLVRFSSTRAAPTRAADLEDSLHKTEFDLEPRKNAFYYKYEIGKLARQGGIGIHKAMELFQEMKSKARLTPECTHFAPLIYGCAKSGHTKKAFELYEESLKYIGTPSNSIITCLINACAESPFPEYGLKRLEWFLTHLRVNFTNKELNVIHYNTAIKAYGKLGKLEEASRLFQEMLNNKIQPDTNSFNCLLIGCASNMEAGSAIALRVYKRMKMYDVKPDLITYRILLRCVRDCGMGSAQLIEQMMGELPAISSLDRRIEYKKSSRKKSSRSHKENFVWAPLITDLGSYMLEAVKIEDSDSHVPAKLAKESKSRQQVVVMNPSKPPDNEIILSPDKNNDRLPNLLSDDHLDLVTRIRGLRYDQLNRAASRLELFGGLLGYLETMLRDGCKPDNKTFSLLIRCFEPTRENFLSYYELSKRFNIERDRLFYDLLIERVCREATDLELGLQFLEKMHEDGLRPHISTFESMANGCYKWPLAQQLMGDLEASGFVVSDKMMREFFSIACHKGNFYYLNKLIELSVGKNFRPTKFLVDKLENCRLRAQQAILKQEQGKSDGSRVYTERVIEAYDKFRVELGKWLNRVELSEEEHPWAQMEEQSQREPSREWQSGFVEHFKALNRAKMEALEKGGPIGNLDYKARKFNQQSSNK